jgi:hypothetical protein
MTRSHRIASCQHPNTGSISNANAMHRSTSGQCTSGRVSVCWNKECHGVDLWKIATNHSENLRCGVVNIRRGGGAKYDEYGPWIRPAALRMEDEL